jgi:hypothetical protein
MNFNFFGKSKKVKGIRHEDLPEENSEFPDSNRPYGLCLRCNKQSSFDNLGSLPGTFDNSAYVAHQNGSKERLLFDRVTSLNCRNCDQPTVVFEEQFVGDHLASKKNVGGIISWRGFFWWPFMNINSIQDIPESISAILQEAKTCYSAQCYRASAVLSRRTLEAIIADKGATEKSLYLGIKKMRDLEIIDKSLNEWATEIRLIGNSGAHFDPMEKVEKIDAEKVIMFTEELIKYIYILPAEIARRRTKNTNLK